MIQREWRKVIETKLSSTTDEYGQIKEDPTTEREIEVVLKQYQATNIQNPLYADITMIALTDDFSVDTDSIITVDGKKYGVKYTIPTRTYLEVFLYERNS